VIEPPGRGAREVRRHDVIRDPPPSETFDLIHARLGSTTTAANPGGRPLDAEHRRAPRSAHGCENG